MNKSFQQFVKYLQLTENSDDYIKNIATNFKKVFVDKHREFEELKIGHFDDDNTLFKYISDMVDKDKDLRIFSKKKDDTTVDYDVDGEENPNQSLSFTTKVHVLESIIKYASFFKPFDYHIIYRKSVSEVRRFAKKSKLRQQGKVSVSIQDNILPRHLVSELMNQLRVRQTYINSVIYRWLKFGKLYKGKDDLTNFGQDELQPFIELSMRFTFVPMSLNRIRNIRIDTATRFIIPEMLYAKDITIIPLGDIIMFNEPKKRLTLVSSTVSPSNNMSIVRTAKEISTPLSIYIYFMSRYCSKTNSNRLTNTKTVRNIPYLFNGPQGGSWKQENIPTEIREYALKKLNISNDMLNDLGLYLGKRTRYIEDSYVKWVASTTSNQCPSKVERAIIATRRLSVANEDRQNRNDMLRSLRFTQDSVNHIFPGLSQDGCVKEYSEHEHTLSPIPVELYHIWVEMCNHWDTNNNNDFTMNGFPGTVIDWEGTSALYKGLKSLDAIPLII